MATENATLMRMARESLKGKWGLAIATSVIYIIILAGIQAIPYLGTLASLFLAGPFALGSSIFYLALSRDENAQIEQLFKGFNNFGTSFVANLLITILVVLWSLLLIVPGIIAAISYSMTYFIIADDNSISAMEAIDKSKKMMYGYKLKFFYMMLRFFGLSLLCLLTFGIGFFWLIPYVSVSTAKFYDDIKSGQDAENYID